VAQNLLILSKTDFAVKIFGGQNGHNRC